MSIPSTQITLLREWADYIEEPDVKAAFWYLVGIASSMDRYECRAQWKGEIRDFRFYDIAGEQPFSFITNRHWLLFYFRLPAVRSGSYSLDHISSLFDQTSVNSAREWTVRVSTVEDVEKLANKVL